MPALLTRQAMLACAIIFKTASGACGYGDDPTTPVADWDNTCDDEAAVCLVGTMEWTNA